MLDSQKPEKSHTHGRLHASTLSSKAFHTSNRHHHRRHHVRDTVQSAVELKPPISFDHLLRRDKKSPDSSRRGSGSQQQHQRDVNEWRERQAQAEREERLRVKPEDVEKARLANVKREEELRQSLKSVEEVGMSSTRQLDDTYYAILEKASILRSTVVSLQQLAEESRRMHQHFGEDTEQLEKETRQNLESFGSFEQQEQAIDDLVSKLNDSKGETDKLNERLTAARNRVEAYERRDNAKQVKRKKRWQATWGTLLGISVLVMALMLLRNYRQVTRNLGGVGEHLARAGDIAHDVLPSGLRPPAKPSEDPYLSKLFDDL